MSMLPNRKNRSLWNLNLTDLGKEVEAKDGFGNVQKGYLSKLRDDETHSLYSEGLIVQHMSREAVIDGEVYYIWSSSSVHKEDICHD